MDLVKVINKYQSEILNDGILIEYKLFFDNVKKKQCKFVIDDNEELEKLNNVMLKIKKGDRNAEIYVNTYGIDFAEEEICIYADTLWINTIIEVEEIIDFFKDFFEIEPSDIALLDKNETMDGTVALVVWEDGKVEDYKAFIEERQLSKIKSLYWD